MRSAIRSSLAGRTGPGVPAAPEGSGGHAAYVALATPGIAAMPSHNASNRRRTIAFVEAIAKWSMADVFAIALFIVYLAAQATTRPVDSGAAPALIAFTAQFGAGFYWFAAYCVFSLASQQYTGRLARAESHGVPGTRRAGGAGSEDHGAPARPLR